MNKYGQAVHSTRQNVEGGLSSDGPAYHTGGEVLDTPSCFMLQKLGISSSSISQSAGLAFTMVTS